MEWVRREGQGEEAQRWWGSRGRWVPSQTTPNKTPLRHPKSSLIALSAHQLSRLTPPLSPPSPTPTLPGLIRPIGAHSTPPPYPHLHPNPQYHHITTHPHPPPIHTHAASITPSPYQSHSSIVRCGPSVSAAGGAARPKPAAKGVAKSATARSAAAASSQPPTRDEEPSSPAATIVQDSDGDGSGDDSSEQDHYFDE